MNQKDNEFQEPCTTIDPKTGIAETILSNGLRILSKERHNIPIVCMMIWYNVGSVYESQGKTGISHFLEHMMFKGTDRYKKGDIDLITEKYGGSNNAYTSQDYTAYYFNFASDRWEIGLEIEANRMRNCQFLLKEFELEKQVILDELNNSIDSPSALLEQDTNAISYKVHPYRNPVIGWKEDLEKITLEDLIAYYNRFYIPNNATLVVVGDFETQSSIRKIQRYFEDIPRGTLYPHIHITEPQQTGERRVTIYENVHVKRVEWLYHTCSLGEPDDFVLDIISAILSYGKTSRLHRRLVDLDKLMPYVTTMNESHKYPGLFSISGELYPDVQTERVESIIIEEVEKRLRKPVSLYELEKAKNQAIAQYIFHQETVSGYADKIGSLAISCSYKVLGQYPEIVGNITVQDIQRVATKYFTSGNRSIGWSLPQKKIRYQPGKRLQESESKRCQFKRNNHVPFVFKEGHGVSKIGDCLDVSKEIFENGLTLFILENHALPLVSIIAYVEAGILYEPESKAGLAHMVGRLLDEGTLKRDRLQIAQMIEYIGGELSATSKGVFVKVLSNNIDLAFDILSDMLMQPSFHPQSIAHERSKVLAEILSLKDEPMAICKDELFKLIYGEHPFGRPVQGYPETVKLITQKDIISFHNMYFVPNNTVLTVVGDVDPSKVKMSVARYFGKWKEQAVRFPAVPEVKLQSDPKKSFIHMNKEQLNISIGHLSVSRSNPDFETLLVMDHILGVGEGFTDRLSRKLRDEEGLAYSVLACSTANAGIEPGIFNAYIGTHPKYMEKAIEELYREIIEFREKGVSKEEMINAKAFLTGNFIFAFETNSQLASHILAVHRYNLGFDYITSFPKRIEAVTLEDIHKVAQKYLHPEIASLVVVGKVEEQASL